MAIQYIGNTISGVSGDTKPTLSANEKGVIFIETDTNKIYQWDTDSWNEIVLSDASTSAKGIASFSSDNFAASSGAITIKNGGVILGTETTGNYVATVAGTDNEVDVSASTGTVTIGLPNDVTIGQDLVVTRNLTVSGTTVTANVNNLTIEDPLLYLANGQSSSPAFDSGFVVERGNTTNVAFIWDESNDEFVTANVPANQIGETAGDVSLDSYAQLKTGKTIVRVHDTDNDVYPTIMMEKSANATVDNYSTVIADNERLGLLFFRGSNGSSMQTGAYIGARAAEDWDGNGLGTDIYFVNKANNSTSEQEALTIEHSGNIGIGNVSPASSHSSANNLVIGTTSNSVTGMSFLTSTSGTSAIYFAESTSGAARYAGWISYNQSQQRMDIGTSTGSPNAGTRSIRLSGGATPTMAFAGAATVKTETGVLTIDGDDGIVMQTTGGGDVVINENVGIGSTPDVKLDVTLGSIGATDTEVIRLGAAGADIGTESRLMFQNGAYPLAYVASGYQTGTSNGFLSFATYDSGWTEAMRIDKDGKTIVRVPTVNATSIDRPLIVMAEDSANAANLAAGSGTGIEFRIAGAHDTLQEGFAAYTAASIDAIRETGPDSESDASLSFKVSQDDTTLDEAMRISSAGQVTIYPGGNSGLHIDGDNTKNIRIDGSRNTATPATATRSEAIGQIHFENAGTDIAVISGEPAPNATATNKYAGEIAFYVHESVHAGTAHGHNDIQPAGSGILEAMRIDSDGNVGIGTVAPVARLHTVFSGTGGGTAVQLENTNADQPGSTLRFYKNSSSPAVNDTMGYIEFKGKNSAAEDTLYSYIMGQATNVTNGAEEGNLEFWNLSAGSNVKTLQLLGGNVGIGVAPSHNLTVYGTSGATQLAVQSRGGTDAEVIIDADAGDDSKVLFANEGTNYWVMGNDNGTGDDFIIADGGDITSSIMVKIKDGTGDVNFYGDRIDLTGATSGASRLLHIENTSNTSGANAQLDLAVGGTSAGDPKILFGVEGIAAATWALGVDNSASDNFVISANAALGTDNVLTLTDAGNVGIGAAPNSWNRLILNGAIGSGYGSAYFDIPAGAAVTATNGEQQHIVQFKGTITEGSSLESPLFTTLKLMAPVVDTTPGGTVLNTAVLYIQDVMSAGTSNNYALFVDAGKSRFDGNIELGGNDIIDIGYTGSSWTTDKLSFKGQTTGTHEIHFWNTQTGNTLAHSRLQISTGNTTAGDSYIQFDNAGNPTFLVGLDTTAGHFAIANTNTTLGTNDALRISVATPPVVSFNIAHSTIYFDYVCDKCGRHEADIFTCCGKVEWHDDVVDFRAMSSRKESAMDYMEKVGVIQRTTNNDGELEIFTTANMMNFVGSMAYQNRQRMDAQYDEHENRFSGKIRKLEALLKKMLGDEKYTLLMDTID